MEVKATYGAGCSVVYHNCAIRKSVADSNPTRLQDVPQYGLYGIECLPLFSRSFDRILFRFHCFFREWGRCVLSGGPTM